jgi:hypothetical protein
VLRRRPAHRGGGKESEVMNLKCVFHVSPASIRSPQVKEVRARMPSLLDLDIEWVDEPQPRGTSIETWQRARGWSTED